MQPYDCEWYCFLPPTGSTPRLIVNHSSVELLDVKCMSLEIFVSRVLLIFQADTFATNVASL